MEEELRVRTSGTTAAWNSPALRAALFVLLYIAADFAVRDLRVRAGSPIIWYPGAGIALACLILYGPRWIIALVVARGVLYATSPTSPPLGIVVVEVSVLAVAYTAGALAIRRKLPSMVSEWRFSHAAWLAGVIAASASLAALSSIIAPLRQRLPAGDIARRFVSFAAGDAAGAIVMLPLLLIISLDAPLERLDAALRTADDTPAQTWQRVFMTVALILAIATGQWLVHSGGASAPYVIIVCLVPVGWFALREGVRGAVVVTVLIGFSFAVGGYRFGVPPDQVPMLQATLFTLGVVALLLGTAHTETGESEARYHHLIATSGEGIWRVDEDSRTVYLNAQMAGMLGMRPEEARGRRVRDFIHPDDRERWDAERTLRAEGQDSSYSIRVLGGDGQERHVLVRASVVRNLTGRVIGSMALVTDITHLREVESQGRRAQRLLEIVFRSSRDAMILFRAEGEVIVDVNDVWCAVTGYTREEVIGRSQTELRIWGDPADSARMAEAVREHGSVRDFEIAFNRYDAEGKAERGYALVSAFPAEFEDTTYFLVSGRDITVERKRSAAEAQLRRLEELGRLAGSVAHDFNNLLTVISAYAQMSEQRLAAGEPVERDDLAEIGLATRRAKDLTTRLLRFSRSEAIEPRVVDAVELVDRSAGMLRSLLGNAITVHIESSRVPIPILADPSQFDQILLNLGVNARDAMANGGLLTVTTMMVTAPAGEVAEVIGPDVLPGQYLALRIDDTGTGMDPETQARIFEPFFTTKSQGNGTGLGLAVVFGIVRQARGAIRVTSEPGRGTTFDIFWPCATSPASSLQPDESRPARANGGGSVLVVEDEAAVLKVAARVLRAARFTVHVAADGEQAITVLAKLVADGTPPDVVVSDTIMPRLGGRELAQRLDTLYPDLPIVLMSGYSASSDIREGLPNVPFPVVGKPLDLAKFVEVVASAVALGRQSALERSRHGA